jgi:hypothetical protein
VRADEARAARNQYPHCELYAGWKVSQHEKGDEKAEKRQKMAEKRQLRLIEGEKGLKMANGAIKKLTSIFCRFLPFYHFVFFNF